MKNVLNKILKLGIKISKEQDYKKLLSTFVLDSMDIASADAGTLYLKNDSLLTFMVTKNNTLKTESGFENDLVDLPPVKMVETNICAYSAIHKQVINIADVYQSDLFNFEGPKKYDLITGYHTKSMLVIPLINNDSELIGVLQLINAMDENNSIIPFSKEIENIIFSVGTEAGIVLSNMLLTKEVEDLLDSVVLSFATAIDSRTPYNANHSKNVAALCKKFSNYLTDNKLVEITDNDKEQLYMAAMLHDVGKMIIPLEVMDKATRLGDSLPYMLLRIDLIKSKAKECYLEKMLTKEEYDELIIYIDKGIEVINKANTCGFLIDDLENSVKEYSEFTFDEIPFITESELKNLLIKKGTLTEDERKIIEDHASYTSKILDKIKFGKKYNKVLFYAGAHHEYLDGTGYPNHLTEKDLDIPVRILTIMDVFESLTAKDRPYKKEMPVAKAYDILGMMVKEGKLDNTLVKYLKDYLIKEGELEG